MSVASGRRVAASGLDASLVDLFHTRVAATPRRLAASCGGARITYVALDQRSDQLAQQLIRCGAGPERIVCLLLPRTLDLLVALVATQKCGAAFLMLDVAHPPERLACA